MSATHPIDRARFRSLVQLAPADIRVKGVPCGDAFIWGPEEAVRNLYHDQSFADRLLALLIAMLQAGTLYDPDRRAKALPSRAIPVTS